MPPLPFGPVPFLGGGRGPNTQAVLEGSNDARTGMPPGIPGGAMCVQRLDDSLNSAIHITYRISLRSSSMPEPRDPLLKVLTIFYIGTQTATFRQCSWLRSPAGTGPGAGKPPGGHEGRARRSNRVQIDTDGRTDTPRRGIQTLGNDPSAGSPTETLLRLLLPLNDQVCPSLQSNCAVTSSIRPLPRAH